MVWIRRLVALLVGGAFVIFVGSATLGLIGALPPPQGSAPGISTEDSEALIEPFEDLMAQRDDSLKKRFVDGVDLGNSATTFDQMRAAVPSGQPIALRLIQWFASNGPNGTNLRGVHEQSFTDRAVRVDTELVRPTPDADWRLLNFYVRSVRMDALTSNRFSFTGRPLAVQGVIVATFAVLIFTFATTLACLLLKDINRRWLWLPFVIVGLTTIRMDINGAWTFAPISFQLFSGGFIWSGSAFQPWVFMVSLPVGAIWFWITRLTRKPSPSPESAF